MLIVDKMIIGGVRFVLDKLSVAVEQELNDDTSLREELLAAQMKVELGEMTQEEFSALEDEVLARIREIRERTGRGGGPIEMGGGSTEGSDGEGGARTLNASDIASVDASFVADDFYGDEPAATAVVDVPASSEEVEAKPVPTSDASTQRPRKSAPTREARAQRKAASTTKATAAKKKRSARSASSGAAKKTKPGPRRR